MKQPTAAQIAEIGLNYQEIGNEPIADLLRYHRVAPKNQAARGSFTGGKVPKVVYPERVADGQPAVEFIEHLASLQNTALGWFAQLTTVDKLHQLLDASHHLSSFGFCSNELPSHQRLKLREQGRNKSLVIETTLPSSPSGATL